MSLITATQWSISYEHNSPRSYEWTKKGTTNTSEKGKKSLVFRFWRPQSHVAGLGPEVNLMIPSMSRRFPDVMFYGHSFVVNKWGYSSERDMFYVWPSSKTTDAIFVAATNAAYDGKSMMPRQKTYTLFKNHCTRRVPHDQFPEKQRKPIKRPVKCIQVPLSMPHVKGTRVECSKE
jgi:hypothetical protein